MSTEASDPPNDQFGERGRHLAVDLQVALDVLLHRERHVSVAYPVAECLPVDLRLAPGGGVAVPHVMQVDLREPGRSGERVEAAGDRVRVRWPTVLPAEQQAVIGVVRP